MAELEVCRICLQSGVKVYKYDVFQLKLLYEELTAFKIKRKDELPQYFCYECATLLHKFHKFKQKCHQGQKVLQALLLNGPITYEVIDRFDRKSVNLQSMLGINTVNIHEKTFLINDRNNDDNIQKFNSDDDASGEVKPEVNNDEINGNSDEKDIKDDINNESIEKLSHTINSLINKAIESVKDGICDSEKKFTESTPDKITENTNKKVFRKRQPKEIDKVGKGNKKIKYKLTKSQNQYLDPSKWRKISLTEEEAVTEFENRARILKYVGATYNCKDCFKYFHTEDIMIHHMKLRHNPSIGLFECNFCHTRWTYKSDIRRHLRNHYTKYECLACNHVVGSEPAARWHEETHLGVARTCNYCGKKFRNSRPWYSHLRKQHGKHGCSKCGVSFVSLEGLRRHKSRHVGKTNKSKVQRDSKTFRERGQIEFEKRNASEKHLKSSALHADINTAHIKLAALKKAPNNKRRPTTCYQCGKHFSSRTLFTKHHREEHPRTAICPPNERHICEICGASLAPASIYAHYDMHTRKKVLDCDTCGRRFVSTAGLKNHLVIHAPIRKRKPLYGCDTCERQFPTATKLKRHLVTHTPVHTRLRLHGCDTCGHKFETATRLKRHHLSHTPIDKHEKLHGCDTCDRQFPTSSKLKRHLVTHTPMHKREKKHVCDTCDRKFETSSRLKRHLVAHSDKKPFKCPLCGKRFTQGSSLKFHHRKLHLKEPYPEKTGKTKTNVIPDPVPVESG